MAQRFGLIEQKKHREKKTGLYEIFIGVTQIFLGASLLPSFPKHLDLLTSSLRLPRCSGH